MIDEAVLYRPFGSTAIMTAQLLKLRELAGRPDVSINILPLSLGASPALRGSFTLLEFDDYPDVLFMEGPRDMDGARSPARLRTTPRPLHTKGA